MDDESLQLWLSMGGSTFESPSGTIVYNNGQTILDKRGNRWNLVNGVVKRNGSNVGITNGGTELLYSGGDFYHFYPGPPSSSWKWDGANWLNVSWPQPVIDRLTRWGANGHFWSGTAYSKDSQTVLKLVAAGCNTYRIGCAAGDVPRFKEFISAYAAPSHIAVYPVALISNGSDEDSSYAKGYSVGLEMGGLKGFVPYYELPNEYAHVPINAGSDGNLRTNYDAALYKTVRGVFRGFVDGVRVNDSKARFIGPAETWCHYGFSDMLWFGTSPDNASGNDALKVQWDITSWHWYDNMGNIESAGGQSLNILQHLATTYGKPIRINEYGCYASSFSDETAITNYLTGSNLMGKWDSQRTTYNITGSDIYELFDDGSGGDEGQFGIVLSDATTNKATRFSAVAAFILAHP